MVRRRSIGPCYGIVGEVHVTIRLGPESDATGHGGWQGERQVEFTIEVTLDLAAGNADFEVVPLLAGGRHIADPEYRRALAFFEFPQHQIVFEAICTNRQVVAVWLQVE